MRTKAPTTEMLEIFYISKLFFHSVISPSIFDTFIKMFRLQLLQIV